MPRERAVPQSIDATIGLVKAQLEAAIRFQSALIVYLQTVTPFVDTKDYEFAGLGRRAAEDVANSAGPARRGDARLRRRAERAVGRGPEALRGTHRRRSAPRPGRRRAAHGGRRGAALDRGGAADPRNRRRPGARRRPARRRRPLLPRRRCPAAPSSCWPRTRCAAISTPGSRISTAAPRTRSANGWPTTSRGSPAPPTSSTSAAGAASSSSCCATPASPPAASTSTPKWSSAASPRASTSPAATRSPTSRELPDASLGGIIACQVVEHLQPDDLLRFIELAARRLRPGGVIVLETINPASWIAFFESYIRDLTHVRPVHPDTLRYLLIANGFQQAEIVWRSPTPESARLQHAGGSAGSRRRRARRGGPDGRSQRRSPERVDVRPARLRRHRPAALIVERPMPTAPPVPRLLGAARVAIVLSALAAPAVHAVLATHQPVIRG